MKTSIEILIPVLRSISDGQVLRLDEEILQKMPSLERKESMIVKYKAEEAVKRLTEAQVKEMYQDYQDTDKENADEDEEMKSEK